MKKIETKIAKNGTKMYYVEGKRVNREVAIETAADNRGGAFIINREKRTSVYSVVSYVESGTHTSVDTYEFNKIYFKTIYNGTELWVNPNTEKFGQVVFESYNKELVKDVATAIEAAFISGEKGVTVKVNGTVEVINAEADPDDYAVSQEALEVATNAEIEAMKVAREERIKAAQKEVADYIAKIDEQEKQEKVAAFERELAEYYAEIELANSKAQTSTPVIDIAEYNTMMTWAEKVSNGQRDAVIPIKTYLSKLGYTADINEIFAYIEMDDLNGFRRFISQFPFRVKDNAGYIQKLYVQEDGQVVLAEIPTSEYPNLNTGTQEDTSGEPDEPKFETGKTYYIKDGDSYYTLKVDARTDKMLTGTTPHGTCKYHIHDTFRGEYIRTHLYDDCGNREMIWAANELTDPIIQERLDALIEYREFDKAREAIEKDCDRFERLRDRCKSGSPKRKEYNQLIDSFDTIIRAFGEKFIAAQDRYNKSLTLRADEEITATQKAIDEHNADLDARGIKYFATVYYFPNGIEGEDMENFSKECTSLDEANAFVSQEDIDGVYVGGIYDAGWQITDRNHNLIADHNTGIKEETQMTIEIPAEGKHEFTIGDDTVCFFNGKFHSVFSLKYHMAIVRDLVGIRHHCIFDADETELYDVAAHETSYDNFMEILHQRGNREKLLALRKDYSITDRLSANNNHMWYVNGKRSGQFKVYNLLQSYGLTIAEFLAEDEAYINERIAAGAAKIAIKAQANFLKDKITRDAKPCDDNGEAFNLIPDVSELNDEQPTTRDKYWQARAWLNRTISKGKEYWFLFGRRVKKDSVDVAAYLYYYGLTPDKFAAEDQKVIEEEQRETAIRWANWQKEWFAEYLADKIKRDSKSYDDSDVVFKLTPDDDDDDDDELIDPPVAPPADIAKYQAAFDEARQISIRAGSGFCKINGEQIWFNYGELRSISSDRYNGEITFNNGRKRFCYRGIVIKHADFLNRMNNEVITVDQKETFAEFCDDYQSPDTGYFKIRIFPKFANGTESSFHATANDFDHALELVELFKTLDLPFVGTIKRNQVSGEEYYRHNRDGSETVNPPQPKLPDNIKDSLQRGMKAALEQYRRCNLSHNQAGANRERECFLICKKAFREVA